MNLDHARKLTKPLYWRTRRRYSHLATGIDPWSKLELLTHRHEGDKVGVDASDDDSPLRHGAGTWLQICHAPRPGLGEWQPPRAYRPEPIHAQGVEKQDKPAQWIKTARLLILRDYYIYKNNRFSTRFPSRWSSLLFGWRSLPLHTLIIKT